MDNKFFPERLDRNKVYECGIFSLYTDKVKLPSGYIIEKYHQIHHHHEGVSHIWIFPNQEWMLEKFGYGLQYLRDINGFAKDNASDADIENVIRTAKEIKNYIESENKHD